MQSPETSGKTGISIGYGPTVDELRQLLRESTQSLSTDHDLLIRLDTKVTVVLQQMLKMLEDHEGRLRIVENVMSENRGAKATLISIVGTGISIAGILIHFYLKQ